MLWGRKSSSKLAWPQSGPSQGGQQPGQVSRSILPKSHVRWLGESRQRPRLSPGASGLDLKWPEFPMDFPGFWFLRSRHCQVIYSQFGLAIHQNDHHARRRFVEWAQNEIAVVPDFHKRILFSDEAHFWLNGYVNKQNCRIWSEANPQVYVDTPLHPEKLTVWCAL
ncbi:hypothetical protein TNCV_1779051 [Trichonephila clavipes]|nr:hypothetical protein TNCV_1779051 [Trichonephila clavipes]